MHIHTKLIITYVNIINSTNSRINPKYGLQNLHRCKTYLRVAIGFTQKMYWHNYNEKHSSAILVTV